VKDALETVWEKAIVAYLTKNFPEESEEDHEQPSQCPGQDSNEIYFE
jgi:hypothetical protein